MEWTDSGIIISSKPHGENAVIVQLLTKEHGFHAGLMRGAKKVKAICQPGNFVEATWKARLEEHLGNYSLELRKPLFAEVFDEPLKLSALNSSCALIRATLSEREPHHKVFDSLSLFLASMQASTHWMQYYIMLELELLKRLGYGLDLTQCVATGDKNYLFYVSPKSGRAVSKGGGEPYKEKLLALPSFLRPSSDESFHDDKINVTEIVDGTVLTRYFLEKYIFTSANNKLPTAREQFVQRLKESIV